MYQLKIKDLEALSLGAALLGSGGGGDTALASLLAQVQLQRYGSVKMISCAELTEEDLVVPMSFMGAPLIDIERLLSGKELDTLLQTVEKRMGKKPTVLMASEIGGGNAFTPLLIAGKWDLPILDADMIGRAFPELQMSSCYLKKMAPTPAFIADCLGNSVIIETKSAHTLERIARSVTVAMGSSSAVAMYLMDGVHAQKAMIPGSFSKALLLGNLLLSARQRGDDPTLSLVREAGATVLGRGTLTDIDQDIKEGFLQGSVILSTQEGPIKVSYQNEYLCASNDKGVLTATPDILVLLEENRGIPISSEMLKYGLQVALLVLPAPKIWETSEGLQLVGPQVFGYQKKENLT